jgi:hypothetical protein
MKKKEDNGEMRAKILESIQQMNEDLLKEKKEKNLNLAISVNGKPVIIPARDL